MYKEDVGKVLEEDKCVWEGSTHLAFLQLHLFKLTNKVSDYPVVNYSTNL